MGKVIVSVYEDMRVQAKGADAEPWRAASGGLVEIPALLRESNQFPSYEYRDRDFDLSIGTSGGSFAPTIRNKTTAELCMRLDQAKISSNFAPEPRPLVVSGPFTVSERANMTKEEFLTERGNRLSAPVPLCAASSLMERRSVLFYQPDLFPNGQMFNVAWKDNLAELTSDGVGNWFRLDVPIEYAGQRANYRITLTARDSKARKVYY